MLVPCGGPGTIIGAAVSAWLIEAQCSAHCPFGVGPSPWLGTCSCVPEASQPVAGAAWWAACVESRDARSPASAAGARQRPPCKDQKNAITSPKRFTH